MATHPNQTRLRGHAADYRELAHKNRNAPSGLTYATMALALEQCRTADALEQIMAYVYVHDLDFSLQKDIEKYREEQETK